MLMGLDAAALLVVVVVLILPAPSPGPGPCTGSAVPGPGFSAVTAVGVSEGMGVFFRAVLLKPCIPASMAVRGGPSPGRVGPGLPPDSRPCPLPVLVLVPVVVVGVGVGCDWCAIPGGARG